MSKKSQLHHPVFNWKLYCMYSKKSPMSNSKLNFIKFEVWVIWFSKDSLGIYQILWHPSAHHTTHTACPKEIVSKRGHILSGFKLMDKYLSELIKFTGNSNIY